MFGKTTNFLKQARGARILCALMLVLCLVCLSGCSMFEGGTQGEEAVAAEKETMSCWTCSMFELLFKVVNAVSTGMMASVAKSAVSFLAVCYGLWLAIFIIKYVGSMQEPDVKAFWKEIAVQTFWVTAGAAMLGDLASGSSSSFLKMIADPIFTGFVDTGLMIITSTGVDIPCSAGGTPESGMICLIGALQEKLNISVGISFLALTAGPTIFIIIVGAGIYCASIMMMVYFPILLLDCVSRYCIIIALLPLCVVAYCFKVTRQVAGKFMGILIEIGLGIVGMCVFIAVTVEIIDKYIDTFIPYVRTPLFFLDDPSAFERAIMGPGITGLIFVFLFLFYFADVILDLMGLFSQGAGGLGKTSQATVQGVKGIAKTSAKVVGFGVNRAMRKLDKGSMKTKELLEQKEASGQQLTDKEKQQLKDANEHLQDRGFLAKDAAGKLHKTKAYEDLQKKGVRSFLAGVEQDWQSGPLSASQRRHDHNASNEERDSKTGEVTYSPNAVADGYEGEVVS